MRWWLPLLLVGCIEDRESPRDKSLPKLAPVTEQPTPQQNTTTFKVSWQDVQATTGCFFFSGPNGRDDQLVGSAVFERNGSELTVTINKIAFRGTIGKDGFSVIRKSHHDYGGSWEVDESISGPRPAEGALRASYRYNECEKGTRCPNQCTINGTIVFSR
jgi:hypothetical protein